MSATAMILTAAMVVPASGPERLSAEIRQNFELCGEWEGSWNRGEGSLLKACLHEGSLSGIDGGLAVLADPFIVIGDADGTVQVRMGRSPQALPGIFKWEGDRLVICFAKDEKHQPTSFRAGDGQHLLILHRVKPHK